MPFHRSCQYFSPLLLFIGVSQTLVIEVPRESVNGTVGQSVLLPVTYRLNGTFYFPLPIQWNFSKTPDPLATYTVHNCSLGAERIPTRCSASNFTHLAYQGRAILFPENASLLLQKLQLSDGGVYSVTFGGVKTREFSLTVSMPHFINRSTESSEPTDTNPPTTGHRVDYIAGSCSALLFLLLLLLCCRWRRGAAGSNTTRIIKQEQVQNPEDAQAENTLHLESTYMNAREAQEHSWTRSEPQTEYATIGFRKC